MKENRLNQELRHLNAHFHCFEQVIIFKNRHAQVNATSLFNVRRLLFLIMTSNI